MSTTDALERRDQLVSAALDLVDDLIDSYAAPLGWLTVVNTREAGGKPSIEQVKKYVEGYSAARVRFIDRYIELRNRQRETAE